MRTALVHDYLNQMGGAERVLGYLHPLLGAPPLYTSVYDRKRVESLSRGWDVRPSFLQRLPFARRRLSVYLPLLPMAFEQFDLSEYDLVVSVSSAWAKGVVTQPWTCHVSYVLTPMRFAWRFHESVKTSVPPVLRALALPLFTWLRTWDVASAARVDRFVAISRTVAERVEKIYRRPADVVHPPVDCQTFRPGDPSPGDHYLVVSRLRDYKRLDLAVRAFRDLGRPLVVIGEGEDLSRLRKFAGRSVEFRGRVSESDLVREYQSCRALVLPGEEDFGLAPLEAQACGRPVLAFAGGGALETVRPEGGPEPPTGVLFHEPTVAALAEGVTRLERTKFDPRAIRAHALGFDVSRFQERFRAVLDRALEEHRARFRTRA